MTAELGELVQERGVLEEKRVRMDERIVLLARAVASIEELMGVDSTKAHKQADAAREYILGPRVADKIRFVLSRWPGRPLTARNIMTLLAELGYKFEDDPRPMATIHSVCHRMVNAKQPVIESAVKDGQKAWRWIGAK